VCHEREVYNVTQNPYPNDSPRVDVGEVGRTAQSNNTHFEKPAADLRDRKCEHATSPESINYDFWFRNAVEYPGANISCGSQWLSIVPIAASRSSYDGLLVFLFMIISGTLAAFAIHRLASDRLRRAPAWDCGYPDPSPATQYTATSFAEPIRRVFGTVLFRAREQVEMPPPGDMRPARLTVQMTDPIWDWLYAPLAATIGAAADRLNRLQFLTIRQFLTLVFCALVILLLVLAVWS
jgi:hypothetical protein